MAENHQEERSIKLVIGNSIKCVKILKLSQTSLNKLTESTSNAIHQQPSVVQDWKQVRESLKGWFRESHIPVMENAVGALLVLNEIQIGPPYRPENCSGTNEVMLWRVQKMLENFHQHN